MLKKNLLIKTGAAGDVLRTTVLLHFLEGETIWVTDEKNRGILPDHYPGLTILTPDHAATELNGTRFKHVLSLEENEFCASLAMQVQADQFTGVYKKNGRLLYTVHAGKWFDMSLVSSFGLEMANKKKKRNTGSFQEIFAEILGNTFHGEPYVIYSKPELKITKGLVGIEKRAGGRWPNKKWGKYDELAARLRKDNYAVQIFNHQDNIRAYLDEIARCEFIVSGDTLAMHAALAYQKPCIGIFNCTSPQEIYDYGLLEKVVNPHIDELYYSEIFSPELAGAVTVDEVYERFKKLIRK